jgi:hypothetical protein
MYCGFTSSGSSPPAPSLSVLRFRRTASIAWVPFHDYVTLNRVFVLARIRRWVWWVKKLLHESDMRVSKVFLQGFYPSLRSQLEINKCICSHCRVTQERFEVLHKVKSQLLQVPLRQHNQLISQTVRFNLELKPS